MIKYQYAPSRDFLHRYEQSVLAPTQRRMTEYLESVPKPFESYYKAFFDAFTLRDFLLCSADNLIGNIHKVYSEFPELADRYWPAYLLAGAPIPFDINKYNARSKADKEILDSICSDAFAFLDNQRFKGLTYLSWLKNNLEKATKYAEKRRILHQISKAALGYVHVNDDYLDIFPDWINDFGKVFNYPDLSSSFGHDIVNEWKIHVCLYCNNEDIQSRGEEVGFRTDLDHFHPKSKFPFLAVTLSNLVPAGGFCNQSYKKDDDMIDYAHPFVSGVSEKTLFYIEYPAGDKLTENNYSVKLRPQGGKVDRNLKGFEIAHLYSSNHEIKSWLSRTFATVDWIVGLGLEDIPEQIINQIIDVSKPPHAVRAKKFMVDSVNQFAGKPVVAFP